MRLKYLTMLQLFKFYLSMRHRAKILGRDVHLFGEDRMESGKLLAAWVLIAED
jgi:hypothetical protein